MLTRYHDRMPLPAPAPGSWAATAVELPALTGARVAVLGLHHREHGTILHLHAGGITMEDDWEYYRAVRPLPTLWIRDSAGRWHATRDYAPQAGRGQRRGHARAGDRPAARGRHPMDRRGGRRAIGPGPCQAAAPLERNPVAATGAGCLAWVQLFDTLGRAGRSVILSPPCPPARRSCPGRRTTPPPNPMKFRRCQALMH